MKECRFLDLSEAHTRLYRRRLFAAKGLPCRIVQSLQDYLYIIPGFAKFQDWTSAPIIISSNSREEADFANLEIHLFEKKHLSSGQVADEDLNEDLNEDQNNEDLNDADEDLNDSATVSGEEYVELMSSYFFRHQAQTFVPCVFECEQPELFDVGPPGPSSVRMINHRLDMPSSTNIPPIQESRL